LQNNLDKSNLVIYNLVEVENRFQLIIQTKLFYNNKFQR